MIKPPKELIDLFKSTHGAMSVAEGIALYNLCLIAPEGDCVELGSHKGKSSVMIAAATKGGKIIFHLVEPEFLDADWMINVAKRIWELLPLNNFIQWPNYSTDILPKIEKIAFLFVDSGDHGEEIVQSEKPLYEDKIVSGGIIAFHDFGNQFTAVARCYEQLIATGKYEPIEIDWPSILAYVKENNLEEGNQSWHLYPELPHSPNFVGALRRK